MNVWLGLTVWRALELGTVVSLLNLQRECIRRGVALDVVSVQGDGLVSRARSRLATMFLRSKADVLLTVDSDIVFEPEDAIRLCREALDRRGLVGGLYLTRSDPAQPALPLPANCAVHFTPKADLVRVDWLVTGFLATPRAVFAKLAEDLPLCDTDGPQAFFPFYAPTVGEIDGVTSYLSEDYAFLKRAREAGFPAYLDPRPRLRHLGTTAFALPDGPVTLTRAADGRLEVS